MCMENKVVVPMTHCIKLIDMIAFMAWVYMLDTTVKKHQKEVDTRCNELDMQLAQERWRLWVMQVTRDGI